MLTNAEMDAMEQHMARPRVATGRVVWFDVSSGEGVVETDDGESLYLHHTCVAGVQPNRYVAPADVDRPLLATLAGRRCTVTIYRNIYSARVETLTID